MLFISPNGHREDTEREVNSSATSLFPRLLCSLLPFSSSTLLYFHGCSLLTFSKTQLLLPPSQVPPSISSMLKPPPSSLPASHCSLPHHMGPVVSLPPQPTKVPLGFYLMQKSFACKLPTSSEHPPTPAPHGLFLDCLSSSSPLLHKLLSSNSWFYWYLLTPFPQYFLLIDHLLPSS